MTTTPNPKMTTTPKIPTVTRIDYNDYSTAFHFDDIAYLTCVHVDDGLELTITLTFGAEITIFESEESMYGELKAVYLDLFTKWKNKCDIERKQDDAIMSYGGY